MRNFTEAEFRGWYPYLHPLLKERLDDYRDERGDSVMISPVDGALGRRLDPNNPAYSQDRDNRIRKGHAAPKPPPPKPAAGKKE